MIFIVGIGMSACSSIPEKPSGPPTKDNSYMNEVLPWVQGSDMSIEQIDTFFEDWVRKEKAGVLSLWGTVEAPQRQWLHLSSMYLQGDRIVFFSTPSCEKWQRGRGAMAGFALVREGVVVGAFPFVFSH